MVQQPKHRKALLGTLALGLALTAGVLSSCLTGGRKAGAQPALILGIMPSVDYLPIAIASEQGFFDDSVELVRFSSPMERDAALQTGSVDGSITDYMSAMLLQSKGQKIVLPVATQGSFRLVFGHNEDLMRLSDLEGKHIGLSSHTVIEYATEKALVSPKGKTLPFTPVEVQKVPIRLEMLRSGELDAAILPEPFATLAATKGLRVVSLPDGIIEHITGLALLRKSYETKRPAVVSLIKGYNKAIAYMKETPREEWVGSIVQLLGIPPEVALQLQLPDYHPAASPDTTHFAPILEWMKAKKLVPHSYQATGLVPPLPDLQ